MLYWCVSKKHLSAPQQHIWRRKQLRAVRLGLDQSPGREPESDISHFFSLSERFHRIFCSNILRVSVSVPAENRRCSLFSPLRNTPCSYSTNTLSNVSQVELMSRRHFDFILHFLPLAHLVFMLLRMIVISSFLC